MNYSQKLKEAMAEITAVLERHDIAGHVILHEPGYSEYLWRIDPSWSVMSFEINQKLPESIGIRFRSKLEDYGGDAARQHREQEASVNMVVHFVEILGRDASIAKNLERMLKKHINFEHTKGVYTHTGEVNGNG